MNYKQYNGACLITSILMLLLLISKFKHIDLCVVLIFGAVFSIIWRSIKLIKGKDNIEYDNNGKQNKLITFLNPLFMLDFVFGILCFICISKTKQINYKFLIIVSIIFNLAWALNFYEIYKKQDNDKFCMSHTMHFVGHLCLLLIFVLTFYFYIK